MLPIPTSGDPTFAPHHLRVSAWISWPRCYVPDGLSGMLSTDWKSLITSSPRRLWQEIKCQRQAITFPPERRQVLASSLVGMIEHVLPHHAFGLEALLAISVKPAL